MSQTNMMQALLCEKYQGAVPEELGHGYHLFTLEGNPELFLRTDNDRNVEWILPNGDKRICVDLVRQPKEWELELFAGEILDEHSLRDRLYPELETGQGRVWFKAWNPERIQEPIRLGA